MHRLNFNLIISVLIIGILSCNSDTQNQNVSLQTGVNDLSEGIETGKKTHINRFPEEMGEDSLNWRELETLIPDAVLDIKYATEDNFTGKVIYDCPACILRKEAAMALIAVADDLRNDGYLLKLYDCYRPAPFQQRLWDVVPDPRYVAPPEKGSNHSRGMAIDLSLINAATGEELDMGTAYDHFGPEAHPGFKGLSPQATSNREILNKAMIRHGFQPITSEWWHFDFQSTRYQVSDFVWNCPDK